MCARGVIQLTMKRRKAAIFGSTMVAILSVPAMMYSFDPNPPIGFTGAPGQGAGCAACHGSLAATSALTITAPSSYIVGGAAVPMSVSIPSSGGFELVILAGTAQAGTLTAGTGSLVKPLGTIQDLSDSASNTSWSFMWTPPTTNVGNVTVYATGGTHGTSYLSTATITAPTVTPPTPTLTVSPSPLSFTATVGGTAPSQNVSVGTSPSSAVMFSATSAVTTPTGGAWLSVSPATGMTPATESVSVSTTGLAAGTYNGSVTFTSSATSPTSVSVPVTLTVTSTPPPPPTGAETFSLVVVDRQSNGSDWLLLDGSGSVDTSNTVTGSGFFTRFRGRSGESEDDGSSANTSIVAGGTWKATSVTSSTGGTLVLQVQLTTTTPSSSTLSTGTLTITNTGSSSGATLAINGGDTFNSAGIGQVSLTGGGTSGGGGSDDRPGAGTGGHDN